VSRKAFALLMYVNRLITNSVSHFQAASTLGISFDPSEVRLKPRLSDPYKWHLSSSMENLFKHPLSKQGARGCKEILSSVGKTIKAVPTSVIQGSSIPGTVAMEVQSVSMVQARS